MRFIKIYVKTKLRLKIFLPGINAIVLFLLRKIPSRA